ncbi:MAG: hypothetical protein WKF74_03045 [Pyrinomonadaceae bacterium]
MYIKAQFTGQAFKDLLRFRTSSMTRPCPQMYFEDAKLMLARVEFLEVTELFAASQRSVNYPNSGPQEHIFEKSRLGLKLKFRVTSTQLNATNDPGAEETREGFVSVALDVVVQNGKDYLSLEVLETDFDSLLSLAGVGKQEMSNLLGAGQVELGLLDHINSLAKDIGSFLMLRHADLGFDIAADRVELRVEFQSSAVPSPSAYAEWGQFYSNSLESITGAGAWAFLIDQRIGTELLSRVITAAVDGTGQFNRDGDISVRWDGGLPGYRASIEGEVIDACQCLWGEIDLDMRFWADAKFSLQNNRLRVDINVDHKVTDVAESACCVLTSVALFPIIGLGLTIKGEITWYEYLVGLALYPTPILLMVAIIAKLSSKFAEGLPLGICKTDPADENHFYCEFDLPALSDATSCLGAKLTVRADSLIGRNDGLVLGGHIEMPRIVDPGIGVDVSGLKYVPPRYNCNGGTDSPEQFETEMRVFRASGNYDFRVCEVHVLGPFKYAAKVKVQEMTCPYSAWVTIAIGFTQYDYEPLKVIVSTTHGAVYAVIPAGAQVSEEHRKEADMAGRLARVSRCYAKSKQWDVRWAIDPAPYTNVVMTRQLWTVVGVAAAGAKRVDVVNETGAAVAEVDTKTGRAFRMSVIDPGDILSVVQDVESGSERLEDADLHAVQTLAGVERELEFATPVVAVDAVRMSPVRHLIVYEQEQLTFFHVNDRGDLLRMGALETGEAEWIGRIRGTLYASLRDGRMLQLVLEGGTAAGWREEHAAKKMRSIGGCGCGGATENPATTEHLEISLPLDTRQFDHLVYKGDMRGSCSSGEARIRNGYWREETEGVLVIRALDRELRGGGEMRMANPAACMVIRLRSGALMAAGQSRNKLESLRVLSRREF